MWVSSRTLRRALVRVLLNLVKATVKFRSHKLKGNDTVFSPYTASFSVPKWDAGFPHKHGANVSCHALETRDAAHRSEE